MRRIRRHGVSEVSVELVNACLILVSVSRSMPFPLTPAEVNAVPISLLITTPRLSPASSADVKKARRSEAMETKV